MANWFYQTDGKEIGPLNEASLVMLIEAGQIKPTDLVRSEDDPVWVVASMVAIKDGAVVRPDTGPPAPPTPPPTPPPAASAAPAPPASQWFYSRSTEGGREGPVSLEALGGLYRKGVVSSGTLVWTQGMPNWTAISGVPAFQPYKPLKRASTSGTKKIVAKVRSGGGSKPKTLARAGASGGASRQGSVVIKPKVPAPIKKKIKSKTVKRPATRKFKPVQGRSGANGGAVKVPKAGPKMARLVRAPGEPKPVPAQPPPGDVAEGAEGAGVQQWMYASHAEGDEFGPIPLPNLLRLFADEMLDGDSIVWTEGMAEWAFASDIPALMDLVNPGG